MPRSVILGSLLCVGTVVVSRWAGILRVGAGPRVVIRGGGVGGRMGPSGEVSGGRPPMYKSRLCN